MRKPKTREQLEAERAKSEAESPRPDGRWTCSAVCGGFRGGSLQGYNVVTTGHTLEYAFEALDRSCHDHLYVGSDGEGLTMATVQNACAFDPNQYSAVSAPSVDRVAVADSQGTKQLGPIEVGGSSSPASQHDSGVRSI